uniref:Uncharacterized protein n=1 Tax=Fervidicoccus fontis TaxID=683846 RepID=A0A7J3SM98_9CREN
MRKMREAFLPHRDLNASINIAHALMRGIGWGAVSPPNQQMRLEAKSPAKRWKPRPSGRVAHLLKINENKNSSIFQS